MDDYAEEFSLILTRTEIYDSAEHLVSRFIGGLRPQLQTALSQFDPLTIAEAHRSAVTFEQKQQRSSTWTGQSTHSRQEEPTTSPTTSPTGAKETDGQQQAPRQADDQNVRRSTRPSALKCYECGELGHRQSACPKKNRRGLVLDAAHEDTEPIYDSYGEEDDKGDDNVVQTVGHTGHLLVLQRSCTVPRRQDTQWLRTNIFKSTCTIRGRMCTFIIDSGSSKNIIADDAVNKLGLIREQHPAPYILGWISENSSMRVTQRVLVSFSIGPHYKDRTYCDVALVDISHVILGRPWEFDRKIIHDGAQNTYSFIWETHQIVLVPTSPAAQIPPPIASTTPPTTLLFSYSTFLSEMRTEGLAFALLQTTPHHSMQTTPTPSLVTVLDEYRDVFPTELPDGLPPLRDIQHHIDLVPGATLPNRPHYRMSPTEHEELRRQVEGLLQKGNIKESLSPCAVPDLLIPKKDGSWRMCVDSRVINKITICYRFPIPRLDDLLDQIGAARFSPKSISKVVIIRYVYGRVMNGRQLSKPERVSLSGWSCLLAYLTH